MARTFPALLTKLRASETVSEKDVSALCELVAQCSSIDEDAAQIIIALNALSKHTEGWQSFYIDTLCEYIICDQAPIGYVSHENAQWLIDHVSEEGIVAEPANIELLINVLERGICVPPELSAFTLNQVAYAMSTGKGPLRSSHLSGNINCVLAEDVTVLNRILQAFGNFGEVAITVARFK